MKQSFYSVDKANTFSNSIMFPLHHPHIKTDQQNIKSLSCFIMIEKGRMTR